MKTNSFVRNMALLAAIALAVPTFAKPFVKTISIAQTAKLGRFELKAGEYRLEIDGNKATVQKGKQIVAESEGRWEDRSAKSGYDSLLLGERSEEHTSELQSRSDLVCRLLLEKKKNYFFYHLRVRKKQST